MPAKASFTIDAMVSLCKTIRNAIPVSIHSLFTCWKDESTPMVLDFDFSYDLGYSELMLE